MDYRLTKSKFVRGLQCPKALYLDVYHPEWGTVSAETLRRFRLGRDFETAIKGTFHPAVDLAALHGHKITDYAKTTADLLVHKPQAIIYEAGFIHHDILILADVLRKNADGTVEIYEIKNYHGIKEVTRQDISVQYHVVHNVLERLCPLTEPKLKLSKLSVIHNDGNDRGVEVDMLKYAQEAEPMVEKNASVFLGLLQGTEPEVAVGPQCTMPYDCPYQQYCRGELAVQGELQF